MSKKALCIVINDYPGTGSDLSGCVNDANDWATTLTGRGFTVTKLLDAQATKAAMVSAMSSLIAGAEPNSTVVITYSGHGTWVPDQNGDEADGRDEGLCPWDIAQGKVLIDDEIAILFAKRAKGVRVLLIADSCHSGSVTRAPEDIPEPGEPKPRFLPLSLWLKTGYNPPVVPPKPPAGTLGLDRAGGDTLLAGCKDEEFSWDTSFAGRPNGAFTYYALKALGSLPANATYADWFKKIRTYLPSSACPQNPQIFGPDGADAFPIFS